MPSRTVLIMTFLYARLLYTKSVHDKTADDSVGFAVSGLALFM